LDHRKRKFSLALQNFGEFYFAGPIQGIIWSVHLILILFYDFQMQFLLIHHLEFRFQQ
jgi:hypothetical protein